MAFAITKAVAFGFEREEPLNNRYHQHLYLTITGTNTDLDLDIGDYLAGSLGTFWTAAGASAVGAEALKMVRDIGTRAEVCHTPEVYANGAAWIPGPAADAKEYTVTYANLAPNLLFETAEAPTSYTVHMSWLLKENTPAILAEAK
jgi:hypothetical protein